MRPLPKGSNEPWAKCGDSIKATALEKVRMPLALSAIDHSDQAVINANPNTQERNTMSPNTANSLVHDLVEMAKAMETLPQVERALKEQEDYSRKLAETISQLGADLEQSRTYAASLEQKVRTVEAERDDAEIRFLELDEKAHKALGMLEMVESYAKDARLVIEPRKPAQPEPVVEAQPQGQGETLPSSELNPTIHGTVASSSSPDQTSVNNIATQSENVSTLTTTNETLQPLTSQDQSEVNPMDQGSSGAIEPIDGEPNPPGPYANKRYHDHPVYVPYWDWIAGGGTKEGYHWHPDVGSSA